MKRKALKGKSLRKRFSGFQKNLKGGKIMSLIPRNDKVGRYGDFFDDFFGEMWPFDMLRRNSIRLDVKESEREYLVEADLPGVNKDEIEVCLEDGRLTISVQKREEVEEERRGRYIHRERRYGEMKRSIYLEGAQEEGTSAKFENGVLKLKITKADNRKARKSIQIQ
jgi:HSP20 family protein